MNRIENIKSAALIFIYDNFYSPVIFQVEGVKYFPIESVYAVFEVKPHLNSANFKYALNKINSVKKLERTSNPINTISGKQKFITDNKSIISGILTTTSSWSIDSKKAELNIIQNLESLGKLDIVCAINDFVYAADYDDNGKCRLLTDYDVAPILFFYFKLLKLLQTFGNPLPIDFTKYGINGL